MAVNSYASLLMIGVAFGLVCLVLAIARHLLQRTSYPMGLSFFLSLAAVLCVGYVVTLFFLTGFVRYNVDAGLVEPLAVPNETPLIELTPPDTSASKPAWVEAAPKLSGDTYEISVASDPKLTAAEAQADLAEKMQLATRKYIDDLLHEGAERVQVDRNFLTTRVQRETYLEPVTLSVGKMVIAHARLAFDNGVRDEFRQQHRAAEVQARMQQAGGIAGLVLLLIGTAFGCLKLDTLTRGYYTGRLQLAAATVILGAVWAGYTLVGTTR